MKVVYADNLFGREWVDSSLASAGDHRCEKSVCSSRDGGEVSERIDGGIVAMNMSRKGYVESGIVGHMEDTKSKNWTKAAERGFVEAGTSAGVVSVLTLSSSSSPSSPSSSSSSSFSSSSSSSLISSAPFSFSSPFEGAASTAG
jgi:hypothetical protein